MGLEYPLIDVNNISESENRLGAELKLAISEDEGSSTIAHHMTLKPGLETLHHQSDNCTEILVCISGKGKATIGSKDIDIHTVTMNNYYETIIPLREMATKVGKNRFGCTHYVS